MPCEITVHLKNGKTVTKTVEDYEGFLTRPMSLAQATEKAVFLCRQIEDAMRDRDFLIGGQRHALFIDGQRDDAGAVALRHGQHFRRPLLAVFRLMELMMALPGMRFSASSTTSASVLSIKIGAGTRVAIFSRMAEM